MGERTHTPGPWLAVGGILQNDEEGNPRFYIRPEPSDGWQVSQTFGPNGEANARLIAAAPDMFEALKAARQFIANGIELGFIRMPDASTPDPAHDTLPAIEAALAKASPHV